MFCPIDPRLEKSSGSPDGERAGYRQLPRRLDGSAFEPREAIALRFPAVIPRQRAKTIAASRGWLPIWPQTNRQEAGEQAHVTALVGEIGADTATIDRHLATFRTRICFPYRGAEEGCPSGHPRRTARSRKGVRNRVQLPLNPGRSR